MLTFGAEHAALAPHPLVLLLAALVLEALFGEARGPLARLPHPVRLIGWIVDRFDQRLNGPDVTAGERRLRGVATVAAVAALAFAAGWLIHRLALHLPFGWLIELALVVALLAQRSLHQHVRQVSRGLGRSLEAGRAAVAHIVGRDVNRLDRHGVARAAIESCAENFSDGVVAPAFWYALLGLPGILVYKAVNTMDSMIGHRSPRYLDFGRAAARLDDLMNLLPARLAGLFIAAAALLDRGGGAAKRALATMRRDAGKHRSPNAGWPEAAMAGALGLALAGPRHYPLVTVDDPWIGDGRPDADVSDIEAALRLLRRACAATAAAVGLALAVALIVA
jgi:adenosylcobinamide-phosphate synthase